MGLHRTAFPLPWRCIGTAVALPWHCPIIKSLHYVHSLTPRVRRRPCTVSRGAKANHRIFTDDAPLFVVFIRSVGPPRFALSTKIVKHNLSKCSPSCLLPQTIYSAKRKVLRQGGVGVFSFVRSCCHDTPQVSPRLPFVRSRRDYVI